jgi:ABC-2 type transport system permease protein
VADTTTAGWLRWATPLGWAEELRPFAGPRPLVLLLPGAATLALLLVAARLAAGRDVGTGRIPARDRADPHLRSLRTPELAALRAARGTVLTWVCGAAAFGYLLGVVSNSISTADVSRRMREQIEKLGAGSIATPSGYLGFVFVFVVLALSLFMCAQVAAARQEEADERLELLLAQPLGRSRWLGGRLLVAVAAAATIALAAGSAAWAGAVSAGADVSLPRLLEAGANALPAAVLFLGIAALAYALLPRASSGISYGVVAVAFLWQLVGSVLGAPHWLLGATPFAHVGLVPARPFRPVAALVLLGLGAAAGLAALAPFRRRDLAGG